MRSIAPQPSLVARLVDAIVADIIEGALPANARLIQDDLARGYGVSRQPVQQALLLLRNQGLVREAPGRGLIVSPIDPEFARNFYEVRSALDGLAARLAALNGAERAAQQGPALIEAGRAAVQRGSLPDQITADVEFHAFLNDLSGNPLISDTIAPHWPTMRRVIGAVLRGDDLMPRRIVEEHAEILAAVVAGDADLAEERARLHVSGASDFIAERLEGDRGAGGRGT